MDDLAWWQYQMKHRAANADTPYVVDRFSERANEIDQVWHELHSAYDTLVGMR